MKHNWTNVLNECIFKLSSQQDFAMVYLKIGVPPKSWPECLARDLAIEFYEKKNTFSLRAAMIDIAPAAEKLVREELHWQTPIAIEQINKAINIGNGLQLAKRITLDPERYGDTIKNLEAITHLDKSVNLKDVAEYEFKSMLMALESTQNANRTIGGYPLLSSLIGGFNDSRITLLVAGSGVGKTTFALNLVLSALKEHSILFVNMEMSLNDMIKRIACIHQEVSQRLLETQNSSVVDICSNTMNFIYNNKDFFITDGSNLTLEQISSSIYKRADEGAKIVVIDYDQKIKMGMVDQEWKEILLAVESLEEVAKKTKTHIIILAQGDENNNPKASKRSVQPCSAVLSFYEEEGKHYLESKKNRFGKKFKLLMNCDFSKYKVTEQYEVNFKKDSW